MVQRIIQFFRLLFAPRPAFTIRRGERTVVHKSRPFQVLGFRGLK